MTLALSLGRRGLGQCWPNPSVGAVLTDSRTGQVLGGAWTGKGGRPHAEAIVLAAAGEAARGSTLYATLEPCSHWGKTPPCADALIASGVRRLVYGILDPDPRVAGQGLSRLREHGVEVVEGPLPREARWLALGHALRVTAGRPFVQLKLAVDADGLIPAGNGAPQFVTSPEARARGHLLRAEADAILVGHGTLTADDPELTCRLPGLEDRSPLRVVMASRGELPPSAKMLRDAHAHPVWLVCADDGSAAERVPQGVTPVPVATDPQGRPGIRATMEALAARGITRLLVEGGPAVAASLLAADFIDEALVFQAAGRVQGQGIRPFGELGISALTRHFSLKLHSERRIGPDRLSVYRRAEFW